MIRRTSPIRRTPLARNSRPIARRARPRPISKRRRGVMVEDAAWRRVVLARCHDVCEWCLADRATDPHHVYGKKAHPRLRHVRSNGVGLSRLCHDRAHAHPILFRRWFRATRPACWSELQSRLGREAA